MINQEAIKSFYYGLVRTYVPIAVGLLLSFLATKNVVVDSTTKDALILGLTGLLQAFYYTVAYALQKFVHPNFGWLLGLASSPSYSKTGGSSLLGK